MRVSDLRTPVLLTLVSIACCGMFSWSAWGEGVDIFPLGPGPGGNGGSALGDDDPGLQLHHIAVFRQDGGDVIACDGRPNAPGLTLEDGAAGDLYEGRAEDAGSLPVAFEIELAHPHWEIVQIRGGLKTTGTMRVIDLLPEDSQTLYLDGGILGAGLAAVFMAPLDDNSSSFGPGRLNHMTRIDQFELPLARLDLNALRADMVAAYGDAPIALEFAVVVADRRGQWSMARFEIASEESVFEVVAKDRGRPEE